MENLNGIRKDYLCADSFRMILKEALNFRPEHLAFNPQADIDPDIQTEQWKAKSAEQRGFDACFKVITGINIEEFNNE